MKLEQVNTCWNCKYSDYISDDIHITCKKNNDYHYWDLICEEWEIEE